MSLLHPWALWLLPLAALPFFLTRRRIDRLPVRVSALELWREAARDTPDRMAPRQRVDPLTVLPAVFLLLLVAALARPEIARSTSHVALVIDTSFSMNARETGGTRLQLARARARVLSATFPSGARVRTIQTGDAPAAAIADRVRAEDPDATVFVFSDAPAPAHTSARWVRIGSTQPNIAVTAVLAHRDAAGQARVAAEVWNFGANRTPIELELSGGPAPPSRHQLTLPRSGPAIVSATLPPSSTVTARLIDNNDALPADDARTVTVAADRPVTVALPQGTDRFVSAAVRANPLVTVASGGGSDVVICAPCETVPAGNRPVLFMPTAGGQPGAPQPLQRLVDTHVVLRGVDLTDVTAVPIPADSGNALAIVTAGSIPALTLSHAGGRRVARLSVDLRNGTFALQPAFPVLLANVIEWLDARDEAVLDDRNAPASESDLRVDPTTAATVGLDAPLTRTREPQPLATALVVIAIAVLGCDTWLRYRRRRRWQPAPRLAVGMLALCAVIGLRLPLGRAALDVMFAIDQSASIPLADQRQMLTRLEATARQRHEGDGVGSLVFGGDVAIDHRPTTQAKPVTPRVLAAPGATNIEAALDVALAVVRDRPAARIVLASDGNETNGVAVRAAARAASAHVPVDVVPVTTRATTGSSVQLVSAPPSVAVAEPFRVDVVIAGTPGSTATVTIGTDDGRQLVREPQIDASGHARVALTERRDRPGTSWYRAWTEGEHPEDAPGAAVVAAGRPQVLLVGDTAALPDLARAGYGVSRAAASAIPTTAAALAGYDTIVFGNIDLHDLAPAAAAAVAEHVRNGGGLAVFGGPELAAHRGTPTPLDEVLPIDLRPRQGRRGDELAYVLLVDASGSMADTANGIPKIELARQSVLQVLDVIPDDSAVGAIGFAAQPSVLASLAAGARREVITTALRSLAAGGPTSVAPAIDLAADWLKRSTAARKRVLLISDGRTSGSDAARLLAAARSRAFELSVVAIGADADQQLLREVAATSGGRAYFPADLRTLPDIVAADAADAAGGGAVRERFVPVASAHTVLAGIDPDAMPPLNGYVVGATRPGATAILVSHLGDPVLAVAPAGLGRVAMYTAGVSSAWSAPMRQWNQASQLWLQTIRWTARRVAAEGLDVHVVDTDSGAAVYIESAAGADAPLMLRNATITAHLPDGSFKTTGMHATAGGSYVAAIDTPLLGAISMEVDAIDALTGADVHVTRALMRTGAQERAQTGSNLPLLQQIAAMTGGRLLGPGEHPFDAARPRSFRDVTGACLILALLIFALDLTVGLRWRRVQRPTIRRHAA